MNFTNNIHITGISTVQEVIGGISTAYTHKIPAVIDGETYYKYDGCIDDTMYWCNKCNEEAAPVHISEWEEIKRENKDAKQKS